MILLIMRVCLLCIAVISLVPASAQTAVWSSPVALSTGGQGWEGAAAIDGNSDSVALWDERTSLDHIWSRAKPGLGNWGPVRQVSLASPGLQTTYVFPAVRITAAGLATAVWTDSDGVWTADRPPSSKWNSPQLLIPGASNPIFVMNSQGDAAIAWTVGGPPNTLNNTVMTVLRPAGQAWTAQQTLATGVFVTADHAGISANGAVIVTWESFHAICREICVFSSFILHASRQNAGTGTWVDSGPLLGPTYLSHDGRVALDPTSRAMLLARNGSGNYISATQAASGGAWSAFDIADVQGIPLISDLASDDAGNVTLVYEAINGFNSQAFVAGASISNNTWSPSVVLSGSDMNVSSIYFALAPNGTALAAWLSSSPTPEIHAVTRVAGTWGSPLTVSQPGNSEIAPEAAAVNSSGAAIVIYSGYNAADVHTEYAVNYLP